MIKVHIHIQNTCGDGMLYRSVEAVVELQGLPLPGETLYMSTEVCKKIIGAILKRPQFVIYWKNLIVKHDGQTAFMSLQSYFHVKERWFYTEDGSIHLLMEDPDDESRQFISDEEARALIPELQESYEKGQFWY